MNDKDKPDWNEKIEQLCLDDLWKLKIQIDRLIENKEKEQKLEELRLKAQNKPIYNPQLLEKYSINQRQATYLISIFNEEQEIEYLEKQEWVRFGRKPRPTSIWRRLEYIGVNAFCSPSRLHDRMIKEGCIIDQGTGATFGSLATRGLIEVDSGLISGVVNANYITLTKLGRKATREILGIKSQKKRVLSDAKWEALTRVFNASENEEIRDYGKQNYRFTWMYLVEKGLVQEIPSKKIPDHWYYSENRFVITEKGRQFYLDHYNEYQD